MLVFDGLSVFLVSWILFWSIKGGNNAGVDTFFTSPKEYLLHLYQDSIFVSNCKIAGPETMLNWWQGSDSNRQKQENSIPYFSAFQK